MSCGRFVLMKLCNFTKRNIVDQNNSQTILDYNKFRKSIVLFFVWVWKYLYLYPAAHLLFNRFVPPDPHTIVQYILGYIKPPQTLFDYKSFSNAIFSFVYNVDDVTSFHYYWPHWILEGNAFRSVLLLLLHLHVCQLNCTLRSSISRYTSWHIIVLFCS